MTICPVCNIEFVPSHKAHIFCSKYCCGVNYRFNNTELKIKKKQYYELHKEVSKIKSRLWYKNNKDYAKKRDREYYLKNKQRDLPRKKEYAKKYYEKNILNKKEYAQKHKKEKSEYNKLYRKKHEKKLNEYCKLWRKNNKEKCIKYSKNSRIKNKDAIRIQGMKSYYKYREKRLAHSKQYRALFTKEQKRHDQNLQNIREYKKRHTNIAFKLRKNLANRIRNSIKKNIKSKKTEELTGCSFEFLKSYLESKWLSGMSWDNYSFRGWHIDHIIPCASFDLSKSEEQKKCFHYTNLQPLWWQDNLSKNDSLEWSKA